jgi:hypothetical protein
VANQFISLRGTWYLVPKREHIAYCIYLKINEANFVKHPDQIRKSDQKGNVHEEGINNYHTSE